MAYLYWFIQQCINNVSIISFCTVSLLSSLQGQGQNVGVGAEYFFCMTSRWESVLLQIRTNITGLVLIDLALLSDAREIQSTDKSLV